MLHHFKSKPELLGAVAEPCRRALADLLRSVEVDDPPTRSQRRGLLTSFADLMLKHRGALGLLANDVSARTQLEPGDRWPAPLGRLVTLLAGSNATILTQLRVTAALGAMVQPVTSAWLHLDDAGTSGELIDAALAVIDGPGSPALTVAS